jgi:flavodoxin
MAKILIAYFSHWGHTREMAKIIQTMTEGDLFEIRTDHYYPFEHDPCSMQAHEEQLKGYRPPLSTKVQDFGRYDIVMIGHPIWWYREPMIIQSFWKAYDFSGKIVIPFCTSGDTGIENTEMDTKNALPRSIVKQGLRLGSYDMNQKTIRNWLRKDGVLQ